MHRHLLNSKKRFLYHVERERERELVAADTRQKGRAKNDVEEFLSVKRFALPAGGEKAVSAQAAIPWCTRPLVELLSLPDVKNINFPKVTLMLLESRIKGGRPNLPPIDLPRYAFNAHHPNNKFPSPYTARNCICLPLDRMGRRTKTHYENPCNALPIFPEREFENSPRICE